MLKRIVAAVAITIAVILALLLANELYWWARRMVQRKQYYKRAKAQAARLGKPLMVIGDPDAGYTNKLLGASYPCGDVTLDLKLSDQCKRSGGGVEGDVHKTLPTFADNSHVILVSYVLEYVPNLDHVIGELYRVAGSADNIFVVHASPYALWSRLRKSSSPSDPVAVNVITEAPPTSRKIKYFTL
jgi:hypothetical protein